MKCISRKREIVQFFKTHFLPGKEGSSVEAGKEEAIKHHFLAIKSWLNKRAHHTVYVRVSKPDFELGASDNQKHRPV